jgi:predicted  nucleic acid-binding Zn-ribbon protein
MKMAYMAFLAVGMAILCAGGCQEEQVSSGDKGARLMAVENKELKEQFAAEKKKQDDEIKNLNTQCQAEMKKKDDEIKKLSAQLKNAQASAQEPLLAKIKMQDDEIKNLNARFQAEMKKRDDEIQTINKQLAECEQTTSEKAAKEIDKQCQEMVTDLLNWNTDLVAEVERLKAGQADVNSEK